MSDQIQENNDGGRIKHQLTLHTGKPGETQSWEIMEKGKQRYRLRTRQIDETGGLVPVSTQTIGSGVEFGLRLARTVIAGFMPRKQ